jgi:fumarate reductase flavoprotein subunit/NADH-quinone oxidoreductase subunit F
METGEAMREGAFCDLGKKSALTVLSALEKFQGEYESHIRNRACPAGVCVSPSRSLFYIDPVLCDGCTDCMEACPEDCIEGKAGFIHVIEQEDCVKCGKCAEACARGAVKTAQGKLPRLPDRLTRCGRFHAAR